MERFKNILILVLIILLGISVIMYKRKPVVTTNVTNSSNVSSTVITASGKAKITGATSATTLPNGSVAVSGINLSIDTDWLTTSHLNTFSSLSSKITSKYSYNTIGIGGLISVCSDVTFNYGITAIYSNSDVSIHLSYMIPKPEIILGANKTLVSW